MNIDQYLDMFSVNARNRNVIGSARLPLEMFCGQISARQFGNIKKIDT